MDSPGINYCWGEIVEGIVIINGDVFELERTYRPDEPPSKIQIRPLIFECGCGEFPFFPHNAIRGRPRGQVGPRRLTTIPGRAD